MRWHSVSGFKTYLSAGIALVGISAASTLLTDHLTLAQQPVEKPAAKAIDKAEDIGEAKAELVERALIEALGADHPQVHRYRMGLERDRQQGDIVTEEVRGNQTVVVRRGSDGSVTQEVLATESKGAVQPLAAGPGLWSPAIKEVRGFMEIANPKLSSDLRKALERYQAPGASDHEKQTAKEQIVSILGKQFDEDMAQRGKQIAELEKKVAALKEQVEKRKGAKSRMIDLRVEMLMYESEGLGFPSSWQQPAGVGAASFPPFETRTRLALGTPIPPVPAVPAAPGAPAAPPAPGALGASALNLEDPAKLSEVDIAKVVESDREVVKLRTKLQDRAKSIAEIERRQLEDSNRARYERLKKEIAEVESELAAAEAKAKAKLTEEKKSRLSRP